LGRNAEAVQCYVVAVGFYVDQGFIARAVAMAKTIVAMDPKRIDMLERIDPQAAQELRSNKRAPKRPFMLDDRPLTPLPPAPASGPPSAAEPWLQPHPARQAPPRTAARPLPPVPPQLARSLEPPPLPLPTVSRHATRSLTRPMQQMPPPMPPPVPELGTARQARPRQAPPPVPTAPPAPPGPVVPMRVNLEPAKSRAESLQTLSLPPSMSEFYGRALGAAPVLSVDPRAAPNETRFSDAPPPAANVRAFSELEFAARTPTPAAEGLRTAPVSAETLAKLPLFPLFAEVPQPLLSRMIAGSEVVELGHDELVLRSGQKGDALYGIVEGSVNIVVPGQPFQLTLAEGDVFGESSLLEDDKAHADVIVAGRLQALRVPRQLLLELVREHAPLTGLLLQLLTRRLLGNLLQVSPLFADFDARGKLELARVFEVRRAAAGTMLAIVGKKMDGLYISLTGTLRVNQPGAPERSAPAGSMFGQGTILRQTPSQVDVIAQFDMILLRLPQAQFTRVAMQYPMVLARLDELSTSEVVRVTM
ncbi:MAG: hypothetical protein RL701_6426, partial [Pseudomonadota bacterium]